MFNLSILLQALHVPSHIPNASELFSYLTVEPTNVNNIEKHVNAY